MKEIFDLWIPFQESENKKEDLPPRDIGYPLGIVENILPREKEAVWAQKLPLDPPHSFLFII